MRNRVYVLLKAANGKSEQVFQSLRDKPGVFLADGVEGRADVVLVLESGDRKELAEMTFQALASVEDVIEDMQLLVTHNRFNGPALAHSTGDGTYSTGNRRGAA